MPLIRVTYFLEVLSSWCHWAEPTWAKLQSSIGDRAIFSGLVHYEPLAATIDAMLEDVAGYDSYFAHLGSLPQA